MTTIEDALAKRRAMLASEKPSISPLVIDKIAAREVADDVTATETSVATTPGLRVETTTSTQPDLKPSWKSGEFWLAILLPVIVGAVVEGGWLTEDTAKQLGLGGGGSFIIGRQLLKAVRDWRR